MTPIEELDAVMRGVEMSAREAHRIVRSIRPRAACRDMPTAMFFPERNEDQSAAKAVCATCPVCDECLEVALADPNDAVIGIWGGTSGKTRLRMRQQRKAAV